MRRGLRSKRERKKKSNNVKDGIESFWTICPYCYYIYKYEIVYLDCCLRCQNCQRAFQAVAIKGPLPKITMVEGKELYNVSLGLFKICYSSEEIAAADDKETKVDVDSMTIVGYETEDYIDVDSGSNNIQRRRVIANQESTSTHLNLKEFCEKLKEKLGTLDDDRAKQEISQLQSRSCGELSIVQSVGTGDTIRSGIENRRGLMAADHLDNELNGEYECGEMEFCMDNDEIFVDLPEL